MVTPPSWRATKDVSIKDDLAEEVGRMLGYDSITPQAPLIHSAPPPENPERRFHHEARALFVDLGFTESYNYSFVSEEAIGEFGMSARDHVGVTNPIASDQSLLRTSLLHGILKNVRENAKRRDSFRLFEIGMEIHRRAEGLPDEIPHLVAAMYERSGDGSASLFELKRAAECFLPGAKTVPAEARSFEHPARAADISWRGETVGRLFELHPSMVETGRAAMLDLDLRSIRKLGAKDAKYRPIRRYPSSAFDLSVIAGLRERAGDLETRLVSFAGPLLESTEFVRQYSGAPLEEGRKSVSFRVTVGSPERTLSSDEIAGVRAMIIDGMRGLGYELRV